jgi:hypothetical protein
MMAPITTGGVSVAGRRGKDNLHFQLFTLQSAAGVTFTTRIRKPMKKIINHGINLAITLKKIFQTSGGQIVSLLALAALLFAGCATHLQTESNTTETIPFTKQSGGSGSGCPGAYTGYAKMTNSTGAIWLTPPAGTTSGTFTDASGLPAPYLSVAWVKCNNLSTWCNTNSVTFPATSSHQYQLIVYVKSSPPTNGQPMNLQVTWQ